MRAPPVLTMVCLAGRAGGHVKGYQVLLQFVSLPGLGACSCRFCVPDRPAACWQGRRAGRQGSQKSCGSSHGCIKYVRLMHVRVCVCIHSVWPLQVAMPFDPVKGHWVYACAEQAVAWQLCCCSCTASKVAWSAATRLMPLYSLAAESRGRPMGRTLCGATSALGFTPGLHCLCVHSWASTLPKFCSTGQSAWSGMG